MMIGRKGEETKEKFQNQAIYVQITCSLKIENQIMHCTYLMLLTTKLNKTKTIDNIITWHEVLKR